tara:strand:+ start:1650 stop:4238 length:2589 start_codon:yes stop_codon:yes gene_type:complete
MPDQLQLRGGTTTEHNSFTGAAREVTVDTTKKTLVVHDGSQAGGTPLMKESGGNAASSVGIGTGGTNAINIDSNRKIGIGTASPQVLLHLNDTNARMQFTDSSTGSGSGDGVLLGLNGDDDFFINNRETSKSVLFFTQGSERMRVASDGKVGIGTTSPGYKLEVSAETAISGDTRFLTGARHKFIGGGSGNNLELGTYTNNNTSRDVHLTIDSAGQVGIGTTSATSLLTLNHATNPAIRFEDSGTKVASINAEGSSTNIASFEGKALVFAASTGSSFTERMRIATDGKLGLGTTSPSGRLDIQGSSSNEQQIFIRSPQGGAPLLIWNGQGVTDSGDDSRLGIGRNDVAMIYTTANASPVSALAIGNTDAVPIVFSTNNTQRMRIQSDGKVGIGTSSPGRTLDVNGGIRADGTSSFLAIGGNSSTPSEGVAIHRPATSTMAFVTDSTERMRIASDGKVGIGLTDPDQKLEVDGIIKGSSYFQGGASATSSNNYHFGAEGDGTFRIYRGNYGAGTERFRINSDGKTGIGATDPSTAQLVVYRGTSLGGNPIIQARSNHDATNSVKFEIDGDGDAYFSDLVGIGTTGPAGYNANARDIVINRSGNAGITINTGTTAIGRLAFGDADDNNIGQIRYAHAENNMLFDVNANERMRVDSSGRLLLGLTSPLDTTASSFNITGLTSGARIALQGTTTSANTGIAEFFGHWTTNKVAGFIIKSGADTTNKDDGSMHFFTNGGSGLVEALTILNNQKVGVNNTSPSEVLHVTGNILASGTITPNSDIVFKKDIEPLQNALSKITQLLGINFTYKNNNEKSMGLVAQDVEKVYPELIRGEEGNKSLNYMGLTGAIVEAIKELAAKVAALEKL